MGPINAQAEVLLIRKILGYLRTHWWVFALEVGVFIGVAAFRFLSAPSIFQSTASILIDGARRQMVQSTFAGSPAVNSLTRKVNIVQILTGQEALERLRKEIQSNFTNEGPKSGLHLFMNNGIALPSGSLRGMLTLNYDRTSDVYYVTCQASAPSSAHALCVAYVNTIDGYYPEIGQRDAALKKDFVKSQIDYLTKELSLTEKRFSEFQDRNETFLNYWMVNGEGKGFQALLSDANRLRDLLRSNRAVREQLIRSPQAKRGEHTALATAIQAMTARISDLQFQLQLTRQSPNPDKLERLRTLNAEIRDLSGQLARLNESEQESFLRSPIPATAVREKLVALELEYRTETTRLKNIENEMTNLQKRDREFQAEKLEYERFQSEIANKRRLLQTLYVKEQEAEIELSSGGAEVLRLQEPSQSAYRVSPRLGHIVAATSMQALMLMVFSLTMLMLAAPRLGSESEVIKLNIPILGKVPLLGRDVGEVDTISPFGLEFLKIMNYRILRETKDIKCPIIVVSSSHTREGKSTVCRLMAAASQAPGRKILFVDGDLLTGNPSVFFGVSEDRTPGLKTVLEGKLPRNEMDLVARTPVEGLSVLPRGGRMESVALPNYLKPVELYLNRLRNEFDIIIIDTPPFFAANLGHQWAALGDLVVIVARLFYTKPQELVDAIRATKLYAKAPIGVAVNGVPMGSIERKAAHYYFSKPNQGRSAA